jgi:hypothetical protein
MRARPPRVSSTRRIQLISFTARGPKRARTGTWVGKEVHQPEARYH